VTRLSQSVGRATALLKDADLAADATVRELLTETTQRRGLDLSDLSPAEQAILIGARSQELQPSPDALAARIIEADQKDRPARRRSSVYINGCTDSWSGVVSTQEDPYGRYALESRVRGSFRTTTALSMSPTRSATVDRARSSGSAEENFSPASARSSTRGAVRT
jgi:hypothetical protein